MPGGGNPARRSRRQDHRASHGGGSQGGCRLGSAVDQGSHVGSGEAAVGILVRRAVGSQESNGERAEAPEPGFAKGSRELYHSLLTFNTRPVRFGAMV